MCDPRLKGLLPLPLPEHPRAVSEELSSQLCIPSYELVRMRSLQFLQQCSRFVAPGDEFLEVYGGLLDKNSRSTRRRPDGTQPTADQALDLLDRRVRLMFQSESESGCVSVAT